MKSGIIAINKPKGLSSARVVARVKNVLGAKKAGHTGTLDPFATGLLLCAINKGTRISGFFLNGRKRYEARVSLGVETDTYDLTGQTVFTSSDNINDIKTEDIEAAVASFAGVQDQVPPIFSALKHQGQPLYKLARQGKKVQKPPRRIEIFDIQLKKIELPHVDIDVFCSPGTYIRSIAFDLGRKLGCGAHLSALCRTRSSAFKLEDAMDLETFERLDRDSALGQIIPLSDCLDFMPKVVVGHTIAKKIRYGQPLLKTEIEFSAETPDQLIRVTDEKNDLLAIIRAGESLNTYNYSCVFSS